MVAKTDHLAKAKSYIAKGEDYYRKAAEEIVAAKKGDPGLTNGAIAVKLGRDESWVRKLIAWVNNSAAPPTSPFGRVEGETERKNRTAARQVAREEPEALAEAISSAPPKAQRRIADRLIKQPATEKSLRNVAKRSTEPATKLPLPKAKSKLGDGVFKLWEACEGCGEAVDDPAELHGHHHDYSMPLDVEWLCRGCHSAIHSEGGAVHA